MAERLWCWYSVNLSYSQVMGSNPVRYCCFENFNLFCLQWFTYMKEVLIIWLCQCFLLLIKINESAASKTPFDYRNYLAVGPLLLWFWTYENTCVYSLSYAFIWSQTCRNHYRKSISCDVLCQIQDYLMFNRGYSLSRHRINSIRYISKSHAAGGSEHIPIERKRKLACQAWLGPLLSVHYGRLGGRTVMVLVFCKFFLFPGYGFESCTILLFWKWQFW